MRRLPRSEVSVDDAASRASAFVYGNVLVLAALIALGPENLSGPHGVLYIVGTAVSTFVAHLLGESVAGRIRHPGAPPAREEVRVHVRNARPIASSATAPALFLAAAWAGWLDSPTAWVLAQAATLGRLALLGAAVARWRGERSPLRVVVAGIVLAAVVALVSVLKFVLTH